MTERTLVYAQSGPKGIVIGLNEFETATLRHQRDEGALVFHYGMVGSITRKASFDMPEASEIFMALRQEALKEGSHLFYRQTSEGADILNLGKITSASFQPDNPQSMWDLGIAYSGITLTFQNPEAQKIWDALGKIAQLAAVPTGTLETA